VIEHKYLVETFWKAEKFKYVDKRGWLSTHRHWSWQHNYSRSKHCVHWLRA